MTIQASIIVDFGAAEEGKFIAAELDAEKNGNKSNFVQGDSVYFRVYSNCAYAVTKTSGTVILVENTETDFLTEVATFVNSNQYTTTKKIKDGTLEVTPVWYGNNLGTLKKTDNTVVSLVNIVDNPLGVCKIRYKSEYDLWMLNAPSSIPDEYSVVILISSE